MRRRRENKSGLLFVIVFVLVAVIVVGKFFVKDREAEQYKKYVKDFSAAIEQYGVNDLEEGFGPQSFSYNDLKNILVSKGYFIEFDNQSVKISGNDITISKSDNKLNYYNYNDLTTMENGLRLRFEYNGKEYMCTKSICNK